LQPSRLSSLLCRHHGIRRRLSSRLGLYGGQRAPHDRLFVLPGGDGHCWDGANPVGSVVMLPDGTLVGTTTEGGSGAGTIFRLHFTDTGVQYEHIWDVCWTFYRVRSLRVPRGHTAARRRYQRGRPILEGTCEDESGRGVYYRLTITQAHGIAILPLDYWGKRTACLHPSR
jgi:hypothetical protein